ncbi:MAG: hypothetical protein ACI4WU_02950 [Bacilli bacterium]
MSKEQIIEKNKLLGINTVFINDDKNVLGYSEGNTIYININSNDYVKINNHELLHFFEETETFQNIKNRILTQLNDSINSIREEYKLKYYGIYSSEEIENGILDDEIVIDVLSGNSNYLNLYDEDLLSEIFNGAKRELDNRKYLILDIKNNVNQMKLDKWEKIFVMNFYQKGIPNGDRKIEIIKGDIQNELMRLYNLNKEYFEINADSPEVIREYESEIKALESRGSQQEADYLKNNKYASLLEIARKYSEKSYEEYKHIIEFFKQSEYNDAFKVLMLRETLSKTYKKEDNKTIINSRKQHETIQGHMILNKTVLDIIYTQLNDYSNFKELYFAALSVYKNEIINNSNINISNVNTFGKGKWIKFDGKQSNHDEFINNVQRLKALIQNTHWCTKTLASTHLSSGDFYVFIDNNNNPHIAVRMTGDTIDEVRGIKNGSNQELEEEYYDVILSFLENNKAMENGKEWLERELWNRRLITYIEEIERGEFKTENVEMLLDDLMRVDYKSESKTNSNLEKLKSIISKVYDKIAEYYDCSPEEVCYDYVPDADETVCPYKVILGDANLAGSQLISLGDLKLILGDLILEESKIVSLDKVERIGGDLGCEDSMLRDLGDLRLLGGSLGGAEELESLGKLESIGGGLSLPYDVHSLGNLKMIGEDFFPHRLLEDLGNLWFIGGNVEFNNCKMKSLGNLKFIEGYADFSDSDIVDLGKLQLIGGSAYFSNSKIRNLGNLQKIWGEAHFSKSQVIDLGNLQEIRGDAYFNDSIVETLGKLQLIESDAYFENSLITDLGDVEIDGEIYDFTPRKRR